jgi:hypothetical protein
MKSSKILFKTYFSALMVYFFFLVPLQSVVLQVNSVASEPFRTSPSALQNELVVEVNPKGLSTRRIVYTAIPKDSKSKFVLPLAYLYGKKYTSNQIQNPTFNK